VLAAADHCASRFVASARGESQPSTRFRTKKYALSPYTTCLLNRIDMKIRQQKFLAVGGDRPMPDPQSRECMMSRNIVGSIEHRA
jgi:hypothetical protein